MTQASSSKTEERIEFTNDETTVYLTGSEVETIESDPFLTVQDVVAFRAGGRDE